MALRPLSLSPERERDREREGRREGESERGREWSERGRGGERGEEQNFTLYEIFTMYPLNDGDIFHYFATEGCSHVDRPLKSLMNET